MLEIITSDAIAPHHGFFTRKGGASSGIFAGLNCGTGSTDQAEAVAINRTRVAEAMQVPLDHLVTVHQVHSAIAVPVSGPLKIRPEADAMVTATPGVTGRHSRVTVRCGTITTMLSGSRTQLVASNACAPRPKRSP